ncbi:hypothetical protein DERP_007994, partial [Dermatophagoides pteronyssinus]
MTTNACFLNKDKTVFFFFLINIDTLIIWYVYCLMLMFNVPTKNKNQIKIEIEIEMNNKGVFGDVMANSIRQAPTKLITIPALRKILKSSTRIDGPAKRERAVCKRPAKQAAIANTKITIPNVICVGRNRALYPAVERSQQSNTKNVTKPNKNYNRIKKTN